MYRTHRRSGPKAGEQLAGVINIFNPEMVIIGGVLFEIEEYLIQPINTAIRKYSLNLVNRDSKLVASKFKDKAGVIGSCLLARSKAFTQVNSLSLGSLYQ